jgi:hypothetical protein
MRLDATRALYEGSLAEVGDANPYAGRSLVLAKVWMRGYRRMLLVRVYTSPVMRPYLEARAAALEMTAAQCCCAVCRTPPISSEIE